MKIITSILIVFVIISILFPAPIKAADTENTGKLQGISLSPSISLESTPELSRRRRRKNTGNGTGNTGNVGVTCDARQLQPCRAAITGGGAPSGPCCAKLKEQQTCLCGFAKNPAFAQYISSPNSRKVLAACGVAYPTC